MTPNCRPDYVICILKPHGPNEKKRTLCGKYLVFNPYFMDVQHAIDTVNRKSRQLVCSECAAVVGNIPGEGIWHPPTPDAEVS